MDQIAQLIGAVLILTAFIAAQRGVLAPSSIAYLVLNLVGSAILAVVALVARDWGFLLLEAVWAAVSAWGLLQAGRGGLSPAAVPDPGAGAADERRGDG